MNELDSLYTEDLNLDEFSNEDVQEQGDNIIDTSDDGSIFDPITDKDVQEDNSLIGELLRAKGIDSGKIRIIDEDDQEQEIDFYSLSKEEQLEILNASEQDEPNDLGLSDSELALINHLRTNGLTLEQFLAQTTQPVDPSDTDYGTYEIDAYDDQELYMLDLKNKYDLTDEELVRELEKELQDEPIFQKKVDRLRAEYKELEDQYKENQKVEFEQKRQEQYDQFASQMVDVADKTPEFYGIELEDSEKTEVLSFLLKLDDNGVSEFYKTLNNPTKLYEAAWFLRYGKESFDILKNAYESEISKLKSKDTPPKVIRNTNNKPKNSIHDLNF